MLRFWLAQAMLGLLVLPVRPSMALMTHKEHSASKVQNEFIPQADPTSAAFLQFQQFLQWQQHSEHFAEYLEHRTEFLAWRKVYGQQQPKESRETELMTKEYQRLFPAARYIGQSLISYARTNRTDQTKLEKERSNYAEGVHGKTETVNKTSGSIITNIEDAIVQDAVEAEILAKQAIEQELPTFHFGVGDYFIMSGLLFFLILGCMTGCWGIAWYIVWFWVRFLEVVCNAWNGEFASVESADYEEIQLDEMASIEANGVGPPPKLVFQLEWKELTEGQQFIFKVVGIGDEKWNDAVKKCQEDRGFAFAQVMGVRWSGFTEFQRTMLRKVGIHKDVWDEEDPENLPIHHKTWVDMSDYEKFIASKIGAFDATAWNERKADCFYKTFASLPVDSQIALKRIGFTREHWKPYRDPVVPQALAPVITTMHQNLTDSLNSWRSWLRHRTIAFWLLIQFIWLVYLLYSLGVFSTFWSEFNVYIIIILAVMFLGLALYRLMRPIFHYIDSKVVCEIRVVCAHVKDVWRIVSQLTHIRKCFDRCKHGCQHCCPQGCHAAFSCLPSSSAGTRYKQQRAHHEGTPNAPEDPSTNKAQLYPGSSKSVARSLPDPGYDTRASLWPAALPAGSQLLHQLKGNVIEQIEYV